ncbi:MAG TPA: alkaline phosphatase PhoX [Chthoniobacterales bacterium]
MIHKYLHLRLLSRASLAALVAATGLASASAGPVTIFGRPIIGLPDANPVIVTDTLVSPGFALDLRQQGQDLLENPAGSIARFGYLADGVTATEPDQNLYLVLDHNPGGPTEGYDYGRHFLFQGHENSGDLAYITRINLDVANPDHRVTLLTPPGADGFTHLNSVDGSCWNPFTQTLLFSQERGATGGIFELSADYDGSTNSGLRTLYGSMGQGGFEGVHPDDLGNIYLVEDVGGALFGFAKNPNSFVYRFVPTNKTDLTQGKLQALQVSINGEPVVFHPEGDTLSQNQLDLHTPGTTYPVTWVTIHDTAIDGTAAFDANAAAKTAGATPFKRPENGQFLPGSGFRTFFFDITGDTDANAGNDPALAARGAWGGIFRVELDSSRQNGRIGIVVLGDAAHNSFDNVTFTSRTTLVTTEDRGDTLHDQLDTLDSIWAYDVSQGASSARFVALGQDMLAGVLGKEDNEPTGAHFSDGDASVLGLIGRNVPNARTGRFFFTQQHGENNLYEVVVQRPLDESGQ